MTKNEAVAVLKALPPDDFAEAMEDLEQFLASRPLSPEWIAEIARRTAELDADPNIAIPFEEWSAQTRKKFGFTR